MKDLEHAIRGIYHKHINKVEAEMAVGNHGLAYQIYNQVFDDYLILKTKGIVFPKVEERIKKNALVFNQWKGFDYQI